MLAIHDVLQGADPRHDQTDPHDDQTRARTGSEQNQRAHSARQRRLARELAAAVSEDAFVLHYQPRIALRRGEWTGAEALLRWPHRRRGLLQPADFLALAERTGHLMRIGAWVLSTACQHARTCGLASVSVNISSRQLVEGMLLNQIAEALDVSGLDPDRLEIEIAETILTDAGIETLLTLSAIRDLGVGIALDDFGTGFASLAMLKRLPLTAMKLDSSLIRDIPFDQEDAAIVRAVIATGHALGLTIVAEGIETEAQRTFLSASGCDEGQGFLFSAALSAAELGSRFSAAAEEAPALAS